MCEEMCKVILDECGVVVCWDFFFFLNILLVIIIYYYNNICYIFFIKKDCNLKLFYLS